MDVIDLLHGFEAFDEATRALARTPEHEQEQVTANCKLPEKADAQLHIVLAEVLEGMDAMKAGEGRLRGALRAVVALEA